MLTELSCKAEIAQFNDASFSDENCKSGHVTVSHAHFGVKFCLLPRTLGF